jgi:NAD(P)-dependent dehydrogenase (short-subunit alcohol dehydrogenase family)
MATNFAGTRAVCERLERLIPEGGRIVNVCSLAGKQSILRSPELRSRFENASSAEEVATLSEDFLQGLSSGRWVQCLKMRGGSTWMRFRSDIGMLV